MTIEDSQLQIRNLTRQDVSAVSIIHLKAFPNRAMAALGIEVIRRYYDWLMDDAHTNAYRIGIFSGETMLGFCYGGRFSGAMSGFLQRNRNFLIAKVITHPWLLVTNEVFYSRIRMSFRILKPRQARQMTSEEEMQRAAYLKGFGILAIAVDPAAQGYGVGKQLMASAENEARRRGVEEMNLSVDVGNTQAIHFYERLGWVKLMPANTWNGIMVKSLKVDTDLGISTTP